MKRIKYLLLSMLCLLLAGCGSQVAQTKSNAGIDTPAVTEMVSETEEIFSSQQDSTESGENDDSRTTDTSGDMDGSWKADTSGGTDDSSKTDTSETGEPFDSTLQVHFIDVGQGDSILLIQGEHSMLIDAGDNSCGTKVQSYLQANNISTLDYCVGTHPDADHIGGLDVIIYKFDCKEIWMPQCSKDTKTYEDVISAITSKNYKITNPAVGDTYSLGDAQITVLAPQKDYGEDANNNSIALKVVYGQNSFLFTGDCQEEAEADILASGMDVSAQVMKAGHHGSDTSNSREFLEAVAPEYVVISCGEGNDYGHPRAEVLNNLRSMGISVFRTDEQGSIVAVSDGAEITFNTMPSDSWQAGEPKGSAGSGESVEETVPIESDGEQEQTTEAGGDDRQKAGESATTYILNINTMKIHRVGCSSVSQMSEKNKQTTHKSVEELKAMGYEPCKRCNP